MRRLAYRIALLGICGWLPGVFASAAQADPTMFDEGRAQHAFAAIQDKVGHKFRVLNLTIRPNELEAQIPNQDKPGEV